MENGDGREGTGRNLAKLGDLHVAKKKKQAFSVVKAVKANARERVGQPKAERVIVDKTRAEKRGLKHKKTLGKMLAEDSQ
jgi:hypothetical protein